MVYMVTVTNIVKIYHDGGIHQAITLKRHENSDNARRKPDRHSEAKLIQIDCGPAPDGHARWTLRILEEHTKVELEIPIKKETIRAALKKTNYDLTATNTGASPKKRMPNS